MTNWHTRDFYTVTRLLQMLIQLSDWAFSGDVDRVKWYMEAYSVDMMA